MKQWIVVVIVLLSFHLVFCKTTIKSVNRKKLNSWKKKATLVKHSKSPLDEFANLPPEDYQFIKELDKQFKLHGSRLKIKIERDSNTTKSSKRNIDGDLGYGYHQNNYEGQNYQFSPPKYMIYPYSQHDIPPAPHKEYNNHQAVQHTLVDILPSKSFEIKGSPVIAYDGYNSNRQQYAMQYAISPDYDSYQHQPNIMQYVEPVIVLRVPGPTKYASHLQQLLQQYIEIRASQLIKAFEYSEAEGYYNSPEPYNQHNYEQSSYPQENTNHGYLPPIEQVYHLRKQKPQDDHEQEYQAPPQVEYGVPEAKDASGYNNANQGLHDYQYETQTEINNYHQYQAPVYVPDTHSEQGHHSHPQVQRLPVYGVPVSTTPAIYEHHLGHGSSKPRLGITENNPRDTHTRVIFTDSKNNDHSTSYQLPSIKTPIRPSYLPPHDQHFHYQNNDNNYQHLDSDYQAEQDQPVIAITQRPFNYHAHRAKLLARGQKRDASRSTSANNSNSKKSNKIIITNRIRKHSSVGSHGDS